MITLKCTYTTACCEFINYLGFCVIYFITTALKTVKENIVRKPAYPRTKNSKTCDIYQPALGPRGGLWPTRSHREEACVPAVGTL